MLGGCFRFARECRDSCVISLYGEVLRRGCFCCFPERAVRPCRAGPYFLCLDKESKQRKRPLRGAWGSALSRRRLSFPASCGRSEFLREVDASLRSLPAVGVDCRSDVREKKNRRAGMPDIRRRVTGSGDPGFRFAPFGLRSLSEAKFCEFLVLFFWCSVKNFFLPRSRNVGELRVSTCGLECAGGLR